MISAQAVPASGARTGRAADFGGFGTGWALLISVAGGLALYAAFPPVGAWPLAVLGPALLVVALTGRSLRGSFGCGLAFGLALFVPLLSWLVNEAWYVVVRAGRGPGAHLRGARHRPAAAAPAALLAGRGGGLVGMRRGGAGPVALRLSLGPAGDEPVGRAGRALGRGGRRAAAQLPGRPDRRHDRAGGALLSRGERSPPDPPCRGGPAPVPPGEELAPLQTPGEGWPSRQTVWGPALAAVVTAGLVLAGGLLPVDPTGGAPTVPVAAIQGNVPRARNLPQLLNDTEVTQNHVAATLKLAAQVKAGQLPAPALVIWPENSTDLDPRQNPDIYNELAATVAAIGHPVLVGEVLQNPQRNVGQLWVPGRGPTTFYVKRQLVPFGEYIPFRGIISSFSSLPSLQPVDFTPGHQAVVFDVGKIRLGDVICYEVAFDNLVRSEVTAGANLLAVQSNDADFEIDGQLGETEQQTAMARIRAIESDRAVVYASTTGESTIIAPDGALIAHSGVWQQAILDARVPLVSYRTLADRVGAWPEYVIIMLTVLALAWAVVRSRSRRGGAPAGDSLNLVTRGTVRASV